MKSSAISKKSVQAAVAVSVCLAGAISALAIKAQANEALPPIGVGPGMTAPKFSSVENADPATKLSTSTISALREYHGVEIADAGSGLTTERDSHEAQVSAASQFNFLNNGGRVAEVQLALVTTTRQGEEVRDGNNRGSIQPDLDRRLTWVVVFDHVTMSLGGPRPPEGTDMDEVNRIRGSANAIVAVYVDPDTGKVLGAGQW